MCRRGSGSPAKPPSVTSPAREWHDASADTAVYSVCPVTHPGVSRYILNRSYSVRLPVCPLRSRRRTAGDRDEQRRGERLGDVHGARRRDGFDPGGAADVRTREVASSSTTGSWTGTTGPTWPPSRSARCPGSPSASRSIAAMASWRSSAHNAAVTASVSTTKTASPQVLRYQTSLAVPFQSTSAKAPSTRLRS